MNIERENRGIAEWVKNPRTAGLSPLSPSLSHPFVISINISPGGIPKRPVFEAPVTVDGLVGDGRAHAKHIKPARAVSLLEDTVIEAIRREGYDVAPGVMGENLTVAGLDLQALTPGTRLTFAGGVEIELTEPRAPCFVLDAIHPDLKDAVRGRFGYMARVIHDGILRVGESVTVVGAGRCLAPVGLENLGDPPGRPYKGTHVGS